VLTATGEIFYFADPLEVPAKMEALMTALAARLRDPSEHPVQTAARLHYELVRIHPFDDGNGRVARLLMNYVMLRAGFPPVIIRTEDKGSYLTALQKADAGEQEAFIEYVASEAERGLALAVEAIK
jgi:Fic family protein